MMMDSIVFGREICACVKLDNFVDGEITVCILGGPKSEETNAPMEYNYHGLGVA